MLLTLTEITELFPCHVIGELPSEKLTGISTDSRTIGTGELFVAIRGEKFDGHSFVKNAHEQGAAAVLVDHQFATSGQINNQTLIVVEDTLKAYQEIARFYRQKMAPKVVAITGSAGKTTCKEFTHAVLSQKYNVHKNIKSFNNHIGVPATLLELQPEHEILVAELGTSGFGEISNLSYLVEPNIGVLLNIGYAHIEFLKSLDGVAKAKMEIFDHAVENSTAIYNGDDATLVRQNYPASRKLSFGSAAASDIRAHNIGCDEKGCYHFTVDEHNFKLSIPGRHNIYNALAAIAVGLQFDVSLANISRAIAGVHFVEHRMSVLNTENNVIIDDAYNANPGSCKAALETLADISTAHGRRIAVLGDMLELGEFSQTEHEKLAAVALDNHVDALFLFGNFSTYTAQAAATMNFQFVKHFDKRDELIEQLKNTIKPDDVVLIKGSRSMQMEQVVNALTEKSA
jgi:UDP-N-acetylmuramoyl-tripeptide--D-alanyl-D-alanine ligase